MRRSRCRQGRLAVPLGMFSTRPTSPMAATGALRRASATMTPATAAAPAISPFMSSMPWLGLIEMPPEVEAHALADKDKIALAVCALRRAVPPQNDSCGRLGAALPDGEHRIHAERFERAFIQDLDLEAFRFKPAQAFHEMRRRQDIRRLVHEVARQVDAFEHGLVSSEIRLASSPPHLEKIVSRGRCRVLIAFGLLGFAAAGLFGLVFLERIISQARNRARTRPALPGPKDRPRRKRYRLRAFSQAACRARRRRFPSIRVRSKFSHRPTPTSISRAAASPCGARISTTLLRLRLKAAMSIALVIVPPVEASSFLRCAGSPSSSATK